MRQALCIFRKDVHHLWPQLAVAAAITALIGLFDSDVRSFFEPARALWVLFWIYLGASAIHQERLAGDRQYWLARPFRWPDVLLAKALFFAAFAALPLVAAEALALAVNGVSPVRHLPTLLLSTGAFAGAVALAAAALASVTESLVQVLWACLALAAIASAATLIRSPGAATFAAAAPLVVAGFPVLLLQYARRATLLSRAVLAGAAVIAAVVPASRGWSVPRDAGPAEIRLALDPTPGRAMRFADAPSFPSPAEEGVALPLVVSGIPSGAALAGERTDFTIDADEAGSWHSGWTASGGLTGAGRLENTPFFRRDGPCWQYLTVDRKFFQAVKDRPAHVRVSVAFALLLRNAQAPLARRGRTSRLPADGVCIATPGAPVPAGVRGLDRESGVAVMCGWPRPAPDRAFVLAGPLEASLTAPYDLLGLGGSVWERSAVAFFAPRDAPLTVESWHTAARFVRELDIPAIRLSGHVAPRATDSR